MKTPLEKMAEDIRDAYSISPEEAVTKFKEALQTVNWEPVLVAYRTLASFDRWHRWVDSDFPGAS